MMDWVAIGLTLRLAGCAALALLVIGLPISYWLATTHWRGRIFVEAIVALPLVLPPTVLGFYLLVAFGSRSVLGQGVTRLTGHLLPFSFGGLVVASVLYSLPFAVQPFTVAFSSLRSHAARRGQDLWCHSPAGFPTRGGTDVLARYPRGYGAEFCAYARGIRGCPHGGRQHPRRHPNPLDFNLRSGAKPELRRRRCEFFVSTYRLFCHSQPRLYVTTTFSDCLI